MNAFSSRLNQSRKYLPVGLGVSFIMVLLTWDGVNRYLSKKENLDWPLDLPWPFCKLLTALLMALVYSRTPKFVCGTIKPMLSFGSEVLLLPLINFVWSIGPIDDFKPPLDEAINAPTIKRMYKPRIFFSLITNSILLVFCFKRLVLISAEIFTASL